MAENEKQSQQRTPPSAKLPQVSLEDALEPVRALADLGAPSTPHVIAQHLGKSYATDARFRTRLGAAGYYGLIEKQGGKRALTERGLAITGAGNGDATRARQEAVMSTSFGQVIHLLRGRPVNDSAVRLRLHDDYGVPEKSAPSVAQALIDAATQADIIKNNSFDAATIEAVASVIPSDTPTAKDSGGTSTPKPTPTPSTTTTQKSKEQTQNSEKVVVEETRPFVPGVQIVVRIDAASLTPQEIAELVRALQTP